MTFMVENIVFSPLILLNTNVLWFVDEYRNVVQEPIDYVGPWCISTHAHEYAFPTYVPYGQ